MKTNRKKEANTMTPYSAGFSEKLASDLKHIKFGVTFQKGNTLYNFVWKLKSQKHLDDQKNIMYCLGGGEKSKGHISPKGLMNLEKGIEISSCWKKFNPQIREKIQENSSQYPNRNINLKIMDIHCEVTNGERIITDENLSVKCYFGN